MIRKKKTFIYSRHHYTYSNIIATTIVKFDKNTAQKKKKKI